MEIVKQGNVSVVRLPDRLMGKAVREMLTAVREEHEGGATHIAIDFGSTSFVDSSGIGSLVSLTKDFKTKGTVLSLRALSDDMKELFAETGLDMIFNIETDAGLDAAKID
ncbi:MAG: STAS domain-containing protein, partial [Chitinivibrionales bacterium]|nr:STAS domain-containing protein [Chitinivibrionales bacterium]MBD3396221.1 STAS domain-containing protein [Chitinivibrionales bacterium]